MRSLSRSLVLHGQIETTIAKAKELRPYIERLVTTSKTPSLTSRRSAMVKIGDVSAVKKLHELASRYSDRKGGYTRIIRLGRVGKRVGEQARIEFV